MPSNTRTAGKKSASRPCFVNVHEEELIRQIRRRPILYGRSRNSKERQHMWKEVSLAVGAPVDDCKKRWETLRSTFVRFYKGQLKRDRKWVFYDQMSFLGKQLEGRGSDVDEQTFEDADYIETLEGYNNSEKDEEASTTPARNENHLISNNDEFLENDTLHYVEREASYAKNELPEEVANHTEDDFDYINNEGANSQSVCCDSSVAQVQRDGIASKFDSHEQFLLSCAPVLRRLSARKNALARLKIQEILFNVEFS